jgi:tail fiber protein gp32
MANIGGFGLQIQIVASTTFPAGVTVTQLADDTDPFDIPSIQIADKAMGVNGDLLTWSKANPILINLAVVPSTDPQSDDGKLSILLEANRVGSGKFGANDVITMTGLYPDGSTITLSKGAITDGMPGNALASAGRLKSKVYNFAFQNKVSVP